MGVFLTASIATVMSNTDELMQQLNVARTEVALRRIQVQLHREYSAFLERMDVSTLVQRNELAMLEGELNRWETLGRRISQLIASHMRRSEVGS
ncbi:hypothetical protein LMG9964_06213 [Paraburkholderia phenoliruptrix]|uniref:Uncharacterized protein n=3 Tax=Paraburkholderia phenoliruptrix TaxID=252970 RepID=K0DUY4_9BURK|nr:hypothetical protein BUPH_08340 [Paraburkholderia phenoliruptrix BR3459a]CAB4052523.1 hypothetical protein LMG9964_06213 [Paraburkholderia phenoliruptrix]